MVLAFGVRGLWFESRPDLIFLPCIYSIVSLLRTLFVRDVIQRFFFYLFRKTNFTLVQIIKKKKIKKIRRQGICNSFLVLVFWSQNCVVKKEGKIVTSIFYTYINVFKPRLCWGHVIWACLV